MFLRLLFLLLLALDVGVAGWLLLGTRGPKSVATTDPGVASLQLLSEVPGGALPARVDAPSSAQSAASATTRRCLSIGPFETQAQTRDAVEALSAHVPRIQFRQQQTTQSRGWWVYLPALKTHEQALTKARALSDKGVHDYYVVTAGDQQNTVSLGLFNDEINAKRRLDQVQALGFKPAMNERVDTLPVYRVDFVLPAATDFDWRSYVSDANVNAQSLACF